jgi:hypothetical protein
LGWFAKELCDIRRQGFRKRFVDGNGGRIAQQWYMNSGGPSITEHKLEEFGNTLWNM